MSIHRIGLCVMLLSLVSLATPAFAQGVGPDSFETLDGIDRYRNIARKSGRLVRGGTLRQVRWDDSAVYFRTGSDWFRIDLETMERQPLEDSEVPESSSGNASGTRRRGGGGVARGRQRNRENSPDGSMQAVCRNYNVVLIDEDRNEKQVTTEGDAKLRFGMADWVYGEELDQTTGMWWSPDSKYLAYYRFDESKVPDYYLTSGLTGLRTEVMTEGYPKPGDPNPVVGIDVLEVDTGRITSIDVGDEPEQYVYNIGFHDDGHGLILSRTNRHQNMLEVLLADPITGSSRVLLQENQSTWQKNRPMMRWLSDGKRYIWETEKDGHLHYELRHIDDGLLNTITTGEHADGRIVQLDEASGLMWYVSHSAENPLNAQLHRVGLDGTGQQRLTSENLHHDRFMIAPGGGHFTCRTQSIEQPPRSVLYDDSGNILAELAVSDLSEMEQMDLPMPEMIRFKAADGQTDLFGSLHKPSDFDPDKRYPLLVDVYGGPVFRFVDNTWRSVNPWCELGFVIVKLENRGLPGRSKAFEGATYLKLGQVDLDDQAAGVRHLLQTRPWLDPDRVGITGHSYGGYMSALALLRYPELFDTAVAGAPVTDWRNYDTIYTERYMRTPEENPDGYKEGSCTNHARNLVGNLLLVHGMVDDNVHPSNSWQLAARLQQRDIPFDMLFFPDSGHGIGSPAYRSRKWAYLQEHLGGPR